MRSTASLVPLYYLNIFTLTTQSDATISNKVLDQSLISSSKWPFQSIYNSADECVLAFINGRHVDLHSSHTYRTYYMRIRYGNIEMGHKNHVCSNTHANSVLYVYPPTIIIDAMLRPVIREHEFPFENISIIAISCNSDWTFLQLAPYARRLYLSTLTGILSWTQTVSQIVRLLHLNPTYSYIFPNTHTHTIHTHTYTWNSNKMRYTMHLTNWNGFINIKLLICELKIYLWPFGLRNIHILVYIFSCAPQLRLRNAKTICLQKKYRRPSDCIVHRTEESIDLCIHRVCVT